MVKRLWGIAAVVAIVAAAHSAQAAFVKQSAFVLSPLIASQRNLRGTDGIKQRSEVAAQKNNRVTDNRLASPGNACLAACIFGLVIRSSSGYGSARRKVHLGTQSTSARVVAVKAATCTVRSPPSVVELANTSSLAADSESVESPITRLIPKIRVLQDLAQDIFGQPHQSNQLLRALVDSMSGLREPAARAAIELMMSRSSEDLHKHVKDLRVCILGADEMARLLLVALFEKHPDIRVALVSRSTDKAQALLDELKSMGGSRAFVINEMCDVVCDSDVVFAATYSKEPIITAADLENLDRRVMLIDLFQNIAPECTDIGNVISYSVDDLNNVTPANAKAWRAEVSKAQSFASEDNQEFRQTQSATPYRAAMQVMAETIREAETEKMSKILQRLQGTQREVVEKLTARVTDALLRQKSVFQLQSIYKKRMMPQALVAMPALPSQGIEARAV